MLLSFGELIEEVILSLCLIIIDFVNNYIYSLLIYTFEIIDFVKY